MLVDHPLAVDAYELQQEEEPELLEQPLTEDQQIPFDLQAPEEGKPRFLITLFFLIQ